MVQEQQTSYELIGLPEDNSPCLMVWGHGWQMDREALRPFANAIAGQATHLLLDFPGFGVSPMPPDVWGTAAYADALAPILEKYRSVKKIIWVGHSFGCRVGLQMAARHPKLVNGLFLFAAAGLPRQHSFIENVTYKCRTVVYKILKHLMLIAGLDTDPLAKKIGGKDYRVVGDVRSLFLNIICENPVEEFKKIHCPVSLIYGANDTQTPSEIGERLCKIIPNTKMCVLPNHDHYSVLREGRQLVLERLSEFMASL